MDKHKYLKASDRRELIMELNWLIPGPELQSVPVLEHREFDFPTIEDALAYASGPSLNKDVKREGVVFKSTEDPGFSFKIISNDYLLKQGK